MGSRLRRLQGRGAFKEAFLSQVMMDLAVVPMYSAIVLDSVGRLETGGGGRGGGDVLDRSDVLDRMHGCSRIIILPRIPTMPGRGMSGFH